MSGTPTVSPRLVLTASASPPTVVGPNATATITAGLTQNSPRLGHRRREPGGLRRPAGELDRPAAPPAPRCRSRRRISARVRPPQPTTRAPPPAPATCWRPWTTPPPPRPSPSTRHGRSPSANTAAFPGGSRRFVHRHHRGYPATTITRTGSLPRQGVLHRQRRRDGDPGWDAGGRRGRDYPLKLTGERGQPDATQKLDCHRQPAPDGSPAPNTGTFTAGSAGSFAVTTSGVPDDGDQQVRVPCPAGCASPTTATAPPPWPGHRRPAGGDSYPLTVKASNGCTRTASQSFTLTVSEAPTITSADHATFTVGSAGLHGHDRRRDPNGDHHHQDRHAARRRVLHRQRRRHRHPGRHTRHRHRRHLHADDQGDQRRRPDATQSSP